MKTFEKSSRIIEVVKEFPGIDQKTISKITELTASTVSRHIKNLVKDGYLEKVERKYYIGEKLSDIKKQKMEV
ncbi:MAG: helix-turn-helix domain-containing protein [Candidatus Aminicenantes bacterium]|jgi:predicted transcriptional regulator